MLLVYPAWVSALDQALIEKALDRAWAKCVVEDCALWFPSDAAAVDAVLVVYEAVAQVLHARRDRQTGDAISAAADDLLDQLIVLMDQNRSARGATLEAFAAAVRAAVPQQAWWTPILLAPSAVPRPAGERPTDRPLLSIAEAAERLNVSEDTIRRMGKRGELTLVSVGNKIKRVSPADVDRLLATPKYKYR